MEKLLISMCEVNLVVEKYSDDEFTIYFQDKKTGCVTQDIVTVRKALNDDVPVPGAVDCLVWADENTEDYTHKFCIKQFTDVR